MVLAMIAPICVFLFIWWDGGVEITGFFPLAFCAFSGIVNWYVRFLLFRLGVRPPYGIAFCPPVPEMLHLFVRGNSLVAGNTHGGKHPRKVEVECRRRAQADSNGRRRKIMSDHWHAESTDFHSPSGVSALSRCVAAIRGGPAGYIFNFSIDCYRVK